MKVAVVVYNESGRLQWEWLLPWQTGRVDNPFRPINRLLGTFQELQQFAKCQNVHGTCGWLPANNKSFWQLYPARRNKKHASFFLSQTNLWPKKKSHQIESVTGRTPPFPTPLPRIYNDRGTLNIPRFTNLFRPEVMNSQHKPWALYSSKTAWCSTGKRIWQIFVAGLLRWFLGINKYNYNVIDSIWLSIRKKKTRGMMLL